jgi:hypothetical protein
VVLVACLAGVSAMAVQVRCVDAAREAARLAARGDRGVAVDAARRIGPGGAAVELRDDGAFVVATVSARSPLWLGIPITAEAVSAREPAG